LVGDTIEIDEYLMSCRVLKRTVEQHAVNRIFQLAALRGVQRLQGRYIKTAKNDMVRNFYEGFGFTKTNEDIEGNATWSADVANYVPGEAFMSSSIDEL
jgi:predicted enzyme involved in methoxymalonyl-ACP biosynthesis